MDQPPRSASKILATVAKIRIGQRSSSPLFVSPVGMSLLPQPSMPETSATDGLGSIQDASSRRIARGSDHYDDLGVRPRFCGFDLRPGRILRGFLGSKRVRSKLASSHRINLPHNTIQNQAGPTNHAFFAHPTLNMALPPPQVLTLV